jgi:hypothetical protein
MMDLRFVLNLRTRQGETMMPRGKDRRWTWSLISLLGLTAGCSCTCHLTSTPPVAEDLCEAVGSIASCSRSHVHVFFLQGHDPIDWANLEALKETMQSLGFPQAWYAPCWYEKHFRKEIARILHDDPKAHFVLVGYGHGVDTAAELAQTVGAQHIPVDLLFCIAREIDQPENVGHMRTVLSGCPELSEEKVHYVDVHSKSLPMHSETIELLSHELLCLAASIPAEADLPILPYPDKEPTPQPVMPRVEKTHDEWDFLKPASLERHTFVPPGAVPNQPELSDHRKK